MIPDLAKLSLTTWKLLLVQAGILQKCMSWICTKYYKHCFAQPSAVM